ncbi:MAG: hypothetical protein JJLCMIEE_00309 [Acidimicrobiales bacterium]|nr:MAG: DUF3866 family protein [Actinomycetota bacterium]MBV6507268.1 hypothetical protein [Acidimicrobiales bacterium]RIK04121.1 MAG: DUF3866 domain-containing protein [Acidobacteriota bacterium]
MPQFHTARVTELLLERPGLQRVMIELEEDEQPGRAYCLTELTGPVDVGDRVIVNTTAVDLGLGTGGWHVVHWNLERSSFTRPGPGHVMKLRYTSLQFDAGTDELMHPELDERLRGLPVVACSVHSQAAVVIATIRHLAPLSQIVYVMTDGGALPLALSDLVAEMVSREILSGTITAGHAFGGEHETVTVASALGLAANVLDADVAVVGMGPGVVGTGSTLGTSAVEAASVANTAAALGGVPIVAVRASSADRRARHRGISHHTETISRLLCHAVQCAAIPPEVSGLRNIIARPVEAPDPGEVLRAVGLDVTTMGRGPAEDPLFFEAAAGAGALAARLMAARRASSH